MAFLNASTDFGLNLLKQSKENESTVISPLSISLALALVHAGAKGKTKDEMREVMAKGSTDDQLIEHYKQIGNTIMNSDKVKFLTANRMYIKKGFEVKHDYLETISKNYQATAESLNFEERQKCADHVNGFVSEVTHEMIKDLVTEENFASTVAILVNAIYLDAKWESPFTAENTYDDDFHISKGLTKTVKFMGESSCYRLYGATDEAEILTLKYQDPAFTFSIILPKEKFGLAKLRANLTGEELQEMLASVKRTYISIHMPKFKIETDFKLKEALEAVGIKEMFDEINADLSGIACGVFISDAKHKAVIEVHEEGTTAAAATVLDCDMGCGMWDDDTPRPLYFNADHPFLFFLSYENSVVFCGTCVAPDDSGLPEIPNDWYLSTANHL